MIRKNLSVLWALSDPGIVLQNLNTHTFCELDEIQERVWAYLDGTHDKEDIISLISAEFGQYSNHDIAEIVEHTIDLLRLNEFIVNAT